MEEIFILMAVCYYKEIAELMHLSHRTIDGYRDTLFEKLRVKSRVGPVLFAIKNRIMQLS